MQKRQQRDEVECLFCWCCVGMHCGVWRGTRIQTPCGRVGEAYKTRHAAATPGSQTQADGAEQQPSTGNYRGEHAGDELGVPAMADALVRASLRDGNDAEGKGDQGQK
ncbi:hypothetical protein PISL3812_02993 [Talaromyces islandicus]|uniref:Uncharacterized protein n=1 Tax=Talaromyces islandicus TaxID=28573 RepID=A0A0U1LTR9_TALIS|nr:hypothetical protein PISL3812_02993 [Talaromyces islandicus]